MAATPPSRREVPPALSLDHVTIERVPGGSTATAVQPGDFLLSRAHGFRHRLIRFVTDRPGHDFRYEIDPSRTESALNWTAPHDFETGLARTIEWYLANRTWWEGVRAQRYAGQRLGTSPGTSLENAA